jgi:cystathionine gamma-synthase
MDQDYRSIVRRSRQPASVSRPLVTPLSPSVVYRSRDADQLDDQYEGRARGYTYAREGHPNADVLAQKIDWLECLPADGPSGGAIEGSGGVVTGSGMAATSAAFLGLLARGDHIVAGDQLYGRSLRLLQKDLPRLGFTATLADPTDAASMERAITDKTRMILVEAVSNPTLRVADMTAIAALARQCGVLLVVDNTFTTPRAFRPFDHGADIVVHSITKMLAGHSDVTLGYVAARDRQLQSAILDAVITWGLTPSPFDCWLAERGLHTFELRFDRAQANAAALADHLAGLEAVESVIYTGRPDHPEHPRADKLFNGNYANMVSFRIGGGREEANRLIGAARHIAFAPTLGDVGTTLSHPASSSHRGLTEEGRAALGITEGFFRISVGVEDIELLKREFTAAIAALL